MRNYFIKRVGHSIFIIAGLMGLLFFAINVLGDPVQLLLDDDASEEAIHAIRVKFGFDRPLYVRFGDFYWDLIRGDFGKSIRHRIDAREMIFDRLPNTAVLALIAWTLGAMGIPLGMLAARRPRGPVDRIVNILSFAVISVPEFWLALMLILIVSVQLDLLPNLGIQRIGTGGLEIHGSAGDSVVSSSNGTQCSDNPGHYDRGTRPAVRGHRQIQGIGRNHDSLCPCFQKRRYLHRYFNGR